MAARQATWTDGAFRRVFGQVLRRLRTERSLSQEALADAVGYHVNHISFLERGVRSPTLIVVFRLATALNSTATELVALVEAELGRATPPSLADP